MKHVEFGNTGERVSEMCLGTMMFGPRCDEGESDRILGVARIRQIGVVCSNAGSVNA